MRWRGWGIRAYQFNLIIITIYYDVYWIGIIFAVLVSTRLDNRFGIGLRSRVEKHRRGAAGEGSTTTSPRNMKEADNEA